MKNKRYLFAGLLMVTLLALGGCYVRYTPNDANDAPDEEIATTEEENLDEAMMPDDSNTIETMGMEEDVENVAEPDAEQNSPQLPSIPDPESTEPGIASVAEDCSNLAEMLDSCTPHTCLFTHPFTGEEMQREIVGLTGDNCSYTEQMPNDGKMDCIYNKDQRLAMADYYETSLKAESIESNINVLDGVSITTIEGEAVENPLDSFLADGTCIVSGL